MSEISERIKECLEMVGVSARAFSMSAGKSEPYLTNSIKQGSIPSTEVIAHLSVTHPEINLKYVLSGAGKKILDLNSVGEPELVYDKNQTIDQIIDEKIDGKLLNISESLKEILLGLVDEEIKIAKEEIKKGVRKS